MKKADYSSYIGKRVMNINLKHETFGKVGIVESADEYGGLTVRWELPTYKSGEKAFLFVDEVNVRDDKEKA